MYVLSIFIRSFRNSDEKLCCLCFSIRAFHPANVGAFFCGFLINCRVFWVARSPRRWFFSHFFALAHTHWIEWVLLCCTLYSIRLENYTSTNLITTAPPSVYVCVLRWKLQSSKWPLEKKHNTHCGQWLWMSRRKSMCIRWFEVKMSILCSEISFR